MRLLRILLFIFGFFTTTSQVQAKIKPIEDMSNRELCLFIIEYEEERPKRWSGSGWLGIPVAALKNSGLRKKKKLYAEAIFEENFRKLECPRPEHDIEIHLRDNN
jgi:hypothetical protein